MMVMSDKMQTRDRQQCEDECENDGFFNALRHCSIRPGYAFYDNIYLIR